MFLAVLHIRTYRSDEHFVHFCCLTPHGVCELKSVSADPVLQEVRLTPHGVCELKLHTSHPFRPARRVSPRMGCVD